MKRYIRNAIIEDAYILIDHGALSSWVMLNYEAGGQGFGGYALYLPKTFTHNMGIQGYAGHFIYRTMEIAGVKKWNHLKGKTVRVDSDYSKVYGIGHIIKDIWFYPTKELINEA